MTRRRTLLLGGLACAGAALAQSRISQLGEAIDKAGAQRMLSQRMGKAWLGQLRPELADRARTVLQASEARFERQLSELLAFAPTPEIAGSYKAMQHRFGDYRALLQSKPSRERVDELLQTSGEMLSLAQVATGQLQQRSAAATAMLVMRVLASAPEGTPAIRDNLELARNQWVFLQSALAGESQGPQAANDVFVASENLLAIMETVTGQFARQLG